MLTYNNLFHQMKGYTLLAFLLTFVVIESSKTNKNTIYPPPKYAYLQDQLHTISPSGCINLQIHPQSSQTDNLNLQYYLNKIQERQFKQSNCNPAEQNSITYHITFVYDRQSIKNKEGYKIMADPEETKIYAAEYQGFVYALQTFSQIIKQGTIRLGLIEDEPQVAYRGIMIDSVRHFISYQYVANLIETMPLAKLNMLHWHLSDDQAFVLQLITHPQLAKSGAFDKSSFYSLAQMKQLIALGKKNAVKIIPEFDTPAHIRAWGLDPIWSQKNLTILCPGGQHYNHQFDLSKSEVYTLASEVLKQVDNLFIDSPYIHLGGDETSAACWDLRPAIKNFMKLKNIKNYDELQMYWRYQMKQALPSSRKVVFWRTKSEAISTAPQDILQFWGAQSEVAAVASKSESKLILSPSDILYLNEGQSFIWENQTFGKYFTWRMIYENFTLFPQGVPQDKILGAEACLWGEVSNEDTFENNLWPRVAAFGLNVWSSIKMETAELVNALVDIRKVLSSKGVQCSPFVSQFCELNAQKCFPSSKIIVEQI